MDEEQAIARADELGAWISGEPQRVEAALPELLDLLRDAPSAETLTAAIIGLSHAYDERAVAALLEVAEREQPDPGVRHALASSLPCGAESEAVRERVIAVLVRLTADVDPDVRDWACFGLGQLEADSDVVRDALAARLNDEHLDTRCEALVALARLDDARVLPAAVATLSGEPDDVTLLELETAATLADPALLPALHRLAGAWAGDDDEHTHAVHLAIRRCSPDAHEQAALREKEVVEQANAALASTPITISLEGRYPFTAARVHCTAHAPAQATYTLWEVSDREPATFDVAATAAQWAAWARETCEGQRQS